MPFVKLSFYSLDRDQTSFSLGLSLLRSSAGAPHEKLLFVFSWLMHSGKEWKGTEKESAPSLIIKYIVPLILSEIF